LFVVVVVIVGCLSLLLLCLFCHSLVVSSLWHRFLFDSGLNAFVLRTLVQFEIVVTVRTSCSSQLPSFAQGATQVCPPLFCLFLGVSSSLSSWFRVGGASTPTRAERHAPWWSRSQEASASTRPTGVATACNFHSQLHVSTVQLGWAHFFW
jgi:hypothetical protein